GVDVDNLLVSQPDYGEQALEIAEALVRSNAVDVVVVDSVAALVPKAELDGDMGDSLPGLHARLMSQALRKLTGIVSKSKTCSKRAAPGFPTTENASGRAEKTPDSSCARMWISGRSSSSRFARR